VASVHRRAGPLLWLFLALLAVAALRTFYLGTIHSAALRQRAQDEHVTAETVPAPRGTITDRNGVVLAVSEPAEDITADPYLVAQPLSAAQKLAPLLGEPVDAVLAKLSERSGFVYLAHALPAKRAKQIAALRIGNRPIEGIEETPTSKRVYPRGTLAAQVLGAIGSSGNGVTGLEYAENAVLTGIAGKREVVSAANGQPVSISEPRREQQGKPISLTLDANIQHRAEQVLGAVGRVFRPKDATAIVMDPRTNAIYAMANWPQVNANDALSGSEESLQNRAVSFDYEPGSTFKVVTFSGALQEGLITPQTTLNVPDQIQVADRTIHDAEEHPEEMLTASQILARSSNVGTIKIGAMLGPDRFNEWVHRFGFGAPTGARLAGEERGLVISPSQYSGSSMGNLPIGQGEEVTPLQVATAYAAVANGGILRPPRLVRSIGGREVPLPRGRRVISASTAAKVRAMLQGVLGPDGTAKEVSIPGYQLAGKTGTASKVDRETGEYSETEFVASFVGFAPASNPQLLCAVMVDEPQTGSIYGGTVAAPAFGQIMAFALPYLGIPPQQ
jgi:cell division protein FtsI (penicillin-binding protein 3)